MLRVFIVTFLCLSTLFFLGQSSNYILQKEQVKEAFDYLNKVREKPSDFKNEIGYFMKSIKPKHELNWNNILAKVAEEKAMDMAKKNYFDHVSKEGRGINIMIHKAGYKLNSDWIKDKKDNSFESISAGAESAVEAIKNLIIDANVRSLGHRKHLLGMNDWYGMMKDIGIGFVSCLNTDNTYNTYCCVIIATHDWED
jgi:uncharacterized protein YkwD